jgi:hypothetical protein
MDVTVKQSVNRQPIALLTDEVRDQAALMGVMNALYNRRCSVLKVEQPDAIVSADNPQSKETRQSE